MAHPTPAAIAAIRSRVTDWTPADSAIAAALNTPAIANPKPQGRVAKPFAATDLLPLLDRATLAGLLGVPVFATILDAINAGSITACNAWVATLALAGLISPAQASGLTSVINATQPDPAWPALASWASINLGRPADSADIAESRPS
jgi:hypothetical protein